MSVRTTLAFALSAAAFAALSAPGQAASAQAAGAPFSASGDISTFGELAYPEASGGLSSSAAATGNCLSTLRLSGQGQSIMFHLTLDAAVESPVSPASGPSEAANALLLDVREAETSLLASSSLSLRGGMLLRNFGIGSYGSPANPFARDEESLQGGYWGVDAEWTPSQALSAIAILSADRAARSGVFSGAEDLDAGILARYTPGALDGALGLYASGWGGGELRPVGYASLPLLGLLASLEAAVSFPADLAQGTGGRKPTESLRFELRKSAELGELSLQLGAAYRGIYPGRDQGEVASLVAASAYSGLPPDPFAPFYGRHYAELSIYAEKTDAFSASAAADIALPWGSVSGEAKLEFYIGDATLFLRVQGVAGESGGEFDGLAAAEAIPALDLRVGVDFSF
ncbi:MAG TPA: hypothetical protein VMV90_15310 [Rectinemataceae bacterium]|nr:hypothetical protein [Rectinemataceae bacterium]